MNPTLKFQTPVDNFPEVGQIVEVLKICRGFGLNLEFLSNGMRIIKDGTPGADIYLTAREVLAFLHGLEDGANDPKETYKNIFGRD